MDQLAGADRLSKLDDNVIGHILSFLPSKEAARAAALSSRYRDAFAGVHTVSLDEPEPSIPDPVYDDQGYLVEFPPGPDAKAPFSHVVSAALLGRHRRGRAAAALRALRVAMNAYGWDDRCMVDGWIFYALQQAGPDLEVDLRVRRVELCCRRYSLSAGNAAGGGEEATLEEGLLVDEPYLDDDVIPASPSPSSNSGGCCDRDRSPGDDDDEDDIVSFSDDGERNDAYGGYRHGRGQPRDFPPAQHTVPRVIFSCAALRSLSVGPCLLAPPAAISLPSLETLLLAHVSDLGSDVQRLISACPRLADLTLEACSTVTALSVLGAHLRRLALRCCHELAAVTVDASELQSLEYRGSVPGNSFLTMHGGGARSVKIDICGAEATSYEELIKLRQFLELFVDVEHLHLESARLGSGVGKNVPMRFPFFYNLRCLELRGGLPDDDTAIVAAVTTILEHAPNLEALSLIFHPHEDGRLRLDYFNYIYCKTEELVDAHHLKNNPRAVLAAPSATIPGLRLREINLVHYQGGAAQRTLAMFLLCNAPAIDELWCELAEGPLCIQTELKREIQGWLMNKSARTNFSAESRCITVPRPPLPSLSSPPTTVAAAGDRLSALPDDVLRRILYFVPFKEAASTSVLSRRYGSLWRSSGAVNLAVRVDAESYRYINFDSHRDAFVNAAKRALVASAGGGHMRRLTLTVVGDDRKIGYFLSTSRNWSDPYDLVDGLVSHSAASRVEELLVAVVYPSRGAGYSSDMEVIPGVYNEKGVYKLKLCSLPSQTLRVLDLTYCNGLTPPSAVVAFRRLATLRLRQCYVQITDLQVVLDCAPELATVHFYEVVLQQDDTNSPSSTVHLRCPAVATLGLELCCSNLWSYHYNRGCSSSGLEIDAPRLRSFRYKGKARRFSLKSPAPDLAQVDLHFLPADSSEKGALRVLFWRFIQNFTNAKTLKLKMDDYLKHIAVVGAARRAGLLCSFPSVEHIEVEGQRKPGSMTVAVSIANLLHCCPAVRGLVLRVCTVPQDATKTNYTTQSFLESKYQEDFDMSVDQFTRRRSKKTTIFSDEACDDDFFPEVPDIAGLSGQRFACLQSCLRRVALQFRMAKTDSFGDQLVKFIAENAMVLEEMSIDSGNRKLSEHLNHKVGRWFANSSKTRSKCRMMNDQTPASSHEFDGIEVASAACVRVLPLERL